jgi:hypothetical protein
MCGYRPTRAQWARTNNTNTNLTHEKSAPWKTVVAGKPASNRRAIGHKAGYRTIHPSRGVIADNPIPGTHATHVRADFQDSARDISARDKRDAIARTQLVIEDANIPIIQGNSLDGDQQRRDRRVLLSIRHAK